MHRSRPALLVTATTVLPASHVWAAVHPSSQTSGTTTHQEAAPSHTSKPRAKVTAHAYKGPVETMQWGPVQVTLIVKSKKITDVKATAPTERARSVFINEQAIPLLRQEVLKAQSAKIDGISGATMTSYAFYDSLLAALKTAHTAHAL